MFDLFGNEITNSEATYVNIYADEIQPIQSIVSGERWMYAAAIYENENNPILEDLIYNRYRKDLSDWESYKNKNNGNAHWSEIRGDDNSKKEIVKRWLDYIIRDCKAERKLYFSLLGINLSNLNVKEFGEQQNFNNIYNRFFRGMIQYSLKKFFGAGVIVNNIYHEDGQQSAHNLFDWHTIFKLDKDEDLSFQCKSIEFLPKSHRDNPKSNIIQLCDVLMGIFKDVHLGIDNKTSSLSKKEILSSNFTQDLLIKRIIRAPKNFNSSYNYANRFHISLFPKIKSEFGSINRMMDNYYDLSKINLGNYHNPNQQRLL